MNVWIVCLLAALLIGVIMWLRLRKPEHKTEESAPAAVSAPVAPPAAPAEDGALVAAITAAIACALAQEGTPAPSTGFVVRRIRRA